MVIFIWKYFYIIIKCRYQNKIKVKLVEDLLRQGGGVLFLESLHNASDFYFEKRRD